MIKAWPQLTSRGTCLGGQHGPIPGEDLEVVLIDPREVPERFKSAEINNAMTVAAPGLARFGGHL